MQDGTLDRMAVVVAVLVAAAMSIALLAVLASCACAQSPTPATDEVLVSVDEWDRTKAERDEAKAAAERLAKMAESFQRQAFECVTARAQEAAK
jgi:hypothetical protein